MIRRIGALGLFALLISSSVRMMAPDSAHALAAAAVLPVATATVTCGASPGIVPAAAPPGYSSFESVSAVAPNDVWAVGSYYKLDRGLRVPLAEHWDGSAWTQIPTAPDADLGELYGVAAVATDDVWAVGYSPYSIASRRPLVEHWDGTQWRTVPTPDVPGPQSDLNAVTAIGPDDVWAVGSHTGLSTPHPLMFHWDGQAWHEVPAPAGADLGVWQAVSGTTANDIWAVGLSYSAAYSAPAPLVGHWTGSQWTVVSLPGSVSEAGVLRGVFARTLTDVWAVGSTNATGTPATSTGGLVLHWDGRQWVQITDSVLTYINNLQGILALATNDVWVVGAQGSIGSSFPPAGQPILIHWDGTAWREDTNLSAVTGGFNAITATGDSGLWAVGAQDTARTLTAQFHSGQWAVRPTPDVGLPDAQFGAVDARTPDDIWAVGQYQMVGNSSLAYPLREHWDGRRWNFVPDDSNLSGDIRLTSVTTLAADNAWAVGVLGDGLGFYGILIQHWDGGQWRTVESTTPLDSTDSGLFGVDAVTTDDIWAVGRNQGAPLSQHWDGTRWTTVPLPNSPTATLRAVVAVAHDNVWAAGDYLAPGNIHTPWIVHWDGATWTEVAVPAGVTGSLRALAATSAGDIWAAGTTGDQVAGDSLILHWDGTAWRRVPSPNGSGPLSGLSSLSAVAADDAWAVGSSRNGPFSAPTEAIVLHWDGSQWQRVASPALAGQPARLTGVAALGPGDVWMVGTHRYDATGTLRIAHTGRFSDVQLGDYFYTPVNYLVTHGIISGYDDCTFLPGANTTRGQLAKIIVGAEGWPRLAPRQPDFVDVKLGSPFYAYIETAYNHGIVSGYADGTFRPGANVTRGQVSKMIVRAQGWAPQTAGGPHFGDVPPASPFYAAIETAYAHGLLSGYADGSFRPGNSATRGQISKIIYLALTGPPATATPAPALPGKRDK